MHYTPFGSTGLTIPPIVFGTTCLGNLYVSMSDQTQRSLVAEWFRQVPGTVLIDSAGKYGAGLALENLGRQLRALEIPPERVVISNKLGWRRMPLAGPEPMFEPGVWVDLEYDAVQDISHDGILRCHAEGNQLLGAPYCSQLASVHDPDEYLAAASDEQERELRWGHILDAYRALQSLKERGDVLGIGVGAKDWTVIRDLFDRQRVDWVMIANSFTVHSHPQELIEFIERLRAENVAIINSAVFNGGFLVGGQFYNYQPVSDDTEDGRALLAWRAQFQAICDEHQVDPAKACVVFGQSPPGVGALALSSSKPARVADNIAALDAEIPAAFWMALQQNRLIDPDFPYLPSDPSNKA